jgi:photosystem II stability/assembly factor-like uncharacterized protein
MPLRPLIPLLLCVLCAGQEYSYQRGFTSEDLRGVSAVSSLVAWASGTHGTYLRTTDGGNNWKAAQVPNAEALDFRDVKAFSADVAYLMSAGLGDKSRVFKTSDGGKTWSQRFATPDPGGFFDCMAFSNENEGVLLGDPVGGRFVLFTTSDGGTQWTRLVPQKMPDALEGEGAFAASGSCLAVSGKNIWFATGGPTARVFHSPDQGQTWTAAETGIVHGNASSGIFSVVFRDPLNGVIGGGDYKHPELEGPNLALTTDGGQTWKLAPVMPQVFISSVALEPGSAGLLAVGSSRTSYASDVQNPIWQQTIDLGLSAASYASDGTAFAVGAKGGIIRFRSMRGVGEAASGSGR